MNNAIWRVRSSSRFVHAWWQQAQLSHKEHSTPTIVADGHKLSAVKTTVHLFDLLSVCCTTSYIQQIHNKPKQCSLDFDLLWTCCSAAANHKTDHSNEPINRTHDVRYLRTNSQQINNKSNKIKLEHRTIWTGDFSTDWKRNFTVLRTPAAFDDPVVGDDPIGILARSLAPENKNPMLSFRIVCLTYVQPFWYNSDLWQTDRQTDKEP